MENGKRVQRLVRSDPKRGKQTATGNVRAVKTIVVSGSQGNATTTASWLYELRDVVTDELLATNRPALDRPLRPGIVKASTHGLAAEYLHIYPPDSAIFGWHLLSSTEYIEGELGDCPDDPGTPEPGGGGDPPDP